MRCALTQGGRSGRSQGGRLPRNDDRGATLVEFALISTLVFALLFGMFTGGVSLSRKNSMTNAVREGARLGATLPADGDWADKVQDRVVALSGGDLVANQVCVKLVQAPADTKQSSTCSLPGTDEPSLDGIDAGECAVLVWARRTSELQVILFSKDLDLTAGTVSRYERDCEA